MPTSESVVSGPVLRAVVFLRTAPSGVAEALELLMPGITEKFGGAVVPQVEINVSDVPTTFQVVGEKLTADELDYAISQSPLKDRVQAAVDQHNGYLVVSVDAAADVFAASAVLSNIAARYADDDNGLAVWLPDADFATTDVMYAGEVDQRPAQVWFHTMAARLDEHTAVAHTIGLPHLGGFNVQLRSMVLNPAQAYTELRGAVAALLEARSLPKPGDSVTIAGAKHALKPAASILGLGEVLEAVPQETAEAPKRKGWFSRAK